MVICGSQRTCGGVSTWEEVMRKSVMALAFALAGVAVAGSAWAQGAAPAAAARGPNQGYAAMSGYFGNSMAFWDKDGKMIAFIYYNADATFREWRMGRWTNGT